MADRLSMIVMVDDFCWQSQEVISSDNSMEK